MPLIENKKVTIDGDPKGHIDFEVENDIMYDFSYNNVKDVKYLDLRIPIKGSGIDPLIMNQVIASFIMLPDKEAIVCGFDCNIYFFMSEHMVYQAKGIADYYAKDRRPHSDSGYPGNFIHYCRGIYARDENRGLTGNTQRYTYKRLTTGYFGDIYDIVEVTHLDCWR